MPTESSNRNFKEGRTQCRTEERFQVRVPEKMTPDLTRGTVRKAEKGGLHREKGVQKQVVKKTWLVWEAQTIL